MNEARRQQYAKALGLSLWYSRVQLPGAPPAPVYDFSGFNQVERPPAPLSGRPPQGAKIDAVPAKVRTGPVASAAALLRPAVDEVAQRPAPAASDEATSLAPGTDEDRSALVTGVPGALVPVFQLRGYRVAGRLLLNLAHPDTDAAREALLLSNLAAAIWGAESAVERLFEFGWPVFANAGLGGQDEGVARRVLVRTIGPWLAETRGLVVFGCPPIWSGLSPSSQLRLGDLGEVSAPGNELPVLATFSLGELLLEPQRKKDVWRHLRSFPTAH